MSMTARIEQALNDIEETRGVRVLYAVEAGSRAWGFASTDSDWDVRFLYVHPVDWYLTIRRPRDVIEVPIDDALDLNGWDIRKALQLFAKCNPPLLEWLRSPIIYRECLSTVQRMRELTDEYFSPLRCLHHYLHMAEGNYRDYLQRDVVRVKKYFYVLRPVLACGWIETHGTMPPTEFDAVVADQLPGALHEPVGELLARKRAGDELASGPRIPAINEYLDERLAHFREVADSLPVGVKADWEVLDGVFRGCLGEAWGRR